MMVMTAKVDMKKIIIALVAVAALILGLVLLFGGNSGEATPTAASGVNNNDARVEFLKGFGWDVSISPKESSQVRIPEETTEVFDRYNALQKSQGYDLSQYAGKSVMRYVYKVNNFPGATEPVYATVLVYKNQVIGGDVTDTSAKGVIQGFKMQNSIDAPVETTPVTQPEETTVPTE
ncbi:MAG: DUF4830 domain-containing protein [Oscillospiraceae bacterium]|nr:DUF4830 domain-containing protein [Oscillospiraceae bacterium]